MAKEATTNKLENIQELAEHLARSFNTQLGLVADGDKTVELVEFYVDMGQESEPAPGPFVGYPPNDQVIQNSFKEIELKVRVRYDQVETVYVPGGEVIPQPAPAPKPATLSKRVKDPLDL